MKISYVKGDATSPLGDGNKLIIHCCNDIGGWGRGFVLALSAKWSAPEKYYRQLGKYILGEVQFVQVEKDIVIANMIGQHDIMPINGVSPIRYDAIKKALIKVNQYALQHNATIHAPRFGAGLAGGDWNVIEKLINENISVDVTIYDL